MSWGAASGLSLAPQRDECCVPVAAVRPLAGPRACFRGWQSVAVAHTVAGCLQESEEEQEIAEALFDLANIAAAAEEEAPAAPEERLPAEEPVIKAEGGTGLRSMLPSAVVEAAEAAGDAADPVAAMVSPRKRQRKPNRNLVLYEEFAGGWCFLSLSLVPGGLVRV